MPEQESRSDWSAIDAVVGTVADREGVEPDELPPLFETVDPDALEALVASSGTDDLAVEVTYSGYRIAIDGDGGVTVEAGADAPSVSGPA